MLKLIGISLNQFKDHLVVIIFASMEKYFSNVMFQITSCFALAHLFFNFSISDLLVSENNGVQIILRGMKKYTDNESLQTTAIFALGSIVMKNGNKYYFLIFRKTSFSSFKGEWNSFNFESNEE